ncbi:MAG: Arm DNA-binding domain-containing protein [Rhodospirillaceae bacterium]
MPIAKADGGGLTFTLSAAGTTAWVLRYRHGGKGRELTLGQYLDVSLKLARQRAGERAECTYLNIIGAMLELLRNPRPGREESDAAVIRELNYSDQKVFRRLWAWVSCARTS